MNRTSVVMLGATGAVGNHAALTLAKRPELTRLSLLGRRPAVNVAGPVVSQHTIDLFEPSSYDGILEGHQTAICALGVGQPSAMSKEEFVRIDHDVVLAFAAACKGAGTRHFELLSSVGSNADSASFYLRTKGKLEEALRALRFQRLSLFHPSMIMTPTNRYGVTQAIALATAPLVSHLLWGSLRKFRSVTSSQLGRAMALNILADGDGVEVLHWDDFMTLSRPRTGTESESESESEPAGDHGLGASG